MNDREKWRKRVRNIRAGGTTSWWGWQNETGFLPSCYCTTVLMHHLDPKEKHRKKWDGDYTSWLRTVLNKFWKQHLSKQQLYWYSSSILIPYKSDEQDMLNIPEEVRSNSWVTFSCEILLVDTSVYTVHLWTDTRYSQVNLPGLMHNRNR